MADSLVRMSFSLAVFYLITFIFVIPKQDCSARFHDGFWCCKMLFVIIIYIGSMWIFTDPFFVGYMQFARVVALLFLLYQGLCMLVVSAVFNDLVYDNLGVNGSLIMTILIFAGNVTWTVF